MNVIKHDLALIAALNRIGFQPMNHHRPALLEFLRYELYDITPQYLWTPDLPRMPLYFKTVLRQIRQLNKE